MILLFDFRLEVPLGGVREPAKGEQEGRGRKPGVCRSYEQALEIPASSQL